MSVDDFVNEFKRRRLDRIVGLLRTFDGSLQELLGLLKQVPELHGLPFSEVFGSRPVPAPAPAPAPTLACVQASVAAFLLERAASGEAKGEADGILVNATHQAIADHVDTTRELVSLILADFSRRALVTNYPRRILVRHLSGLAAVAQMTMRSAT